MEKDGTLLSRRLPFINNNPTMVRTTARPALKAVTRTRPKPTRCNAIAVRSSTMAEGQGSNPADAKHQQRTPGYPVAVGTKRKMAVGVAAVMMVQQVVIMVVMVFPVGVVIMAVVTVFMMVVVTMLML